MKTMVHNCSRLSMLSSTLTLLSLISTTECIDSTASQNPLRWMKSLRSHTYYDQENTTPTLASSKMKESLRRSYQYASHSSWASWHGLSSSFEDDDKFDAEIQNNHSNTTTTSMPSHFSLTVRSKLSRTALSALTQAQAKATTGASIHKPARLNCLNSQT